MLTITETAQRGLSDIVERSGPYIGLRLVVTGELPGAYQPELMFMRDGQQSTEDTLLEFDNLNIYIGPESTEKVKDLKIDVIDTQQGPRLQFQFPPVEWDDPVASRLQELIDQRINPALLSHGGFVALLSARNGVAEIMMGGGCQGCARSQQTLRQGIEAIIKQHIPEIHMVLDCTDHARGENPYYKQAVESQAQESEAQRTHPDDGDQSTSAKRRARRK